MNDFVILIPDYYYFEQGLFFMDMIGLTEADLN